MPLSISRLLSRSAKVTVNASFGVSVGVGDGDGVSRAKIKWFFHYNHDICDGISNQVMILSMMVLVMAMVSVLVMVFDEDFYDCIPMLDSRSIGDSI